mmetsp:Transcript_56116/g.149735  ORF Transcript_56116/g.149735 Transcript_56116/m.149735 type:complete len:223 (-) Transcript_56116:585-1253(-)
MCLTWPCYAAVSLNSKNFNSVDPSIARNSILSPRLMTAVPPLGTGTLLTESTLLLKFSTVAFEVSLSVTWMCFRDTKEIHRGCASSSFSKKPSWQRRPITIGSPTERATAREAFGIAFTSVPAAFTHSKNASAGVGEPRGVTLSDPDSAVAHCREVTLTAGCSPSAVTKAPGRIITLRVRKGGSFSCWPWNISRVPSDTETVSFDAKILPSTNRGLVDRRVS